MARVLQLVNRRKVIIDFHAGYWLPSTAYFFPSGTASLRFDIEGVRFIPELFLSAAPEGILNSYSHASVPPQTRNESS